MADLQQPFTEKDKSEMDKHLLEIDDAEKLIAKAKLAGIDIGDREVRIREAKEGLRKIRYPFFPNQ